MNTDQIEFFVKCATSYVTKLEKFNFVREVTNNFGKNELVLLFRELCLFGLQIEIKYYEEVDPISTIEGDFEFTDGFVSKKDPNIWISGYSSAKKENDKWFVDKQVRLSQYIREEVCNNDESRIEILLKTILYTSIKDKVAFITRLIPDAKFIWKVESLMELENIVLERIGTSEKKEPNESKKNEPLTFLGLFKPEYESKIETLFERLQVNGFTDNNNNWKINNGTNEPAKLYHYLKDKKVFIDIKFAPAIKCFYKEFGCEIVETANGNSRASTRKNANEAKNSVDEKIFDKFLSTWINKE